MGNVGGGALVLSGEVVKLDRKFPMVRLADGRRLRCEHSASLKKGGSVRAVIGDVVDVALPEDHDQGVIERIHPRRTEFIRKDPVDRVLSQTLAANFDRVVIVHPANHLNPKRLERELVLAHETGAEVAVVLTKADLVADGFDGLACVGEGGGVVAEGAPDADCLGCLDGLDCLDGLVYPEPLQEKIDQVRALAGESVAVRPMSMGSPSAIRGVRALLSEGSTSILIGSSGAGKSTLVNLLLGDDVRAVSAVRESDGKGRHKTVSREMLELPLVYDRGCVDVGVGVGAADASAGAGVGGGASADVGAGSAAGAISDAGADTSLDASAEGQPRRPARIVDMPGVRGLGLWEAREGIGAAFSDIEELAGQCRFRDCKHVSEPGCAVLGAVEAGELEEVRLQSYRSLREELNQTKQRRTRASWKNR